MLKRYWESASDKISLTSSIAISFACTLYAVINYWPFFHLFLNTNEQLRVLWDKSCCSGSKITFSFLLRISFHDSLRISSQKRYWFCYVNTMRYDSECQFLDLAINMSCLFRQIFSAFIYSAYGPKWRILEIN